jgi:endonuclease/exonuclease/phosphatase family metal-dependent hydrolase
MTKLKITTFNIRCFGFGGEYYQAKKSELRLPYLKHFIDQNFSDTDVFVFQEIMDPSILHKILPDGFKQYTYEHSYQRHMFIVLACKKGFEISNLTTVPNTALDCETSRPAFYGSLEANGKSILGIVGVHLKSQADHTDSRIEQAKSILKFINGLPTNLPKVLTGDFNTHRIEGTRRNKDDLKYLEEVFEDKLTLVDHEESTYLTSKDFMSLDHFFIENLDTLNIEVYNMFDYSDGQPFKRFYREISDHLPVSLTVRLNTKKTEL